MKEEVDKSLWPEADWERRSTARAFDADAAAAALEFLGEIARFVPLEGGKSNANYRLELRDDDQWLVLRIYEQSREAQAVERQVLQLVRDRIPVAPPLADGVLDDGRPFSVHPWIDGVKPHEAMLAGCAPRALGRRLGETLAAIGELRFEACGLFDPTLGFSRTFESAAHSLVDLVEWSLREGRARTRLSPAFRDAVRQFVSRRSERLETCPSNHLVHGDYKFSNLLVAADGSVRGVLDWEFACAFTPLLDVAILMRHRATFPPEFLLGFEEAFRGSGGELPDDWREVTRLIDIMNLVGFLNASGDRPRTFAAVRTLLAETIGFSDDGG